MSLTRPSYLRNLHPNVAPLRLRRGLPVFCFRNQLREQNCCAQQLQFCWSCKWASRATFALHKQRRLCLNLLADQGRSPTWAPVNSEHRRASCETTSGDYSRNTRWLVAHGPCRSTQKVARGYCKLAKHASPCCWKSRCIYGSPFWTAPANLKPGAGVEALLPLVASLKSFNATGLEFFDWSSWLLTCKPVLRTAFAGARALPGKKFTAGAARLVPTSCGSSAGRSVPLN